ncbi:thiamine diphosphokinase [Rummeliibacillus stabekisii]|uniref:thiamine diphosphokinase n=1 Tax=Rummeliibacillus stabekisii TaxID=241244 RepID=UPI00203F7D86|nr:thiamine diphosphokinase [Rummeliibacillus stabekisii]MCM3315771.1 thiamine diphosphokinase [Rummeliibacillus stabekisii]
MTIVVICAGGPKEEIVTGDFLLSFKNAVFIGADYGTITLMDHGIMPDLAIGDFDSLTESEWSRIQERVSGIEHHPPQKNETDTELAVIRALAYKPEKVILIGATGGRLDHFEANMRMIYRLQEMHPSIEFKIINKMNSLQFFQPGEHKIVADSYFKYISFFAYGSNVLNVTLKNMLYETTDEIIDLGTTRFTSNEIVGEYASISFTHGICLMIRSTDDKE